MLAASRSDRVSRRVAARPASASSSWARSAAYVGLRRRSSPPRPRRRPRPGRRTPRPAPPAAARSTPRASPRRWRRTLWSARARSSSARCSERIAASSACSAATCADRRPSSARSCSVAGVVVRQRRRDLVDDRLPPVVADQPGTGSRVERVVGSGRQGRHLDGRVTTEVVVGQRVPDRRAAEARPAGRREAGDLAQRGRDRGDRRQDGRDQRDHPQAQPLRERGRVGHGRPVVGLVTRRPGRRRCRRRPCRRPRWRRRDRTSGTRRPRRVSERTVSSSTWWSPARSKCQYSVVRRVRVTSKRVRLPQPAQRHRSPSAGTRRSAVGSATGAPLCGGVPDRFGQARSA